jgi:hypothetical protein
MTTKICPKCQEILPTTAFNKASRRDGFQTYCRACHNKMQREKYNSSPEEKIKRQIRAGRRKERDPLVAKKSELKRLYGITFEDYTKMFVDQGEVCAICKENCQTKNSLSVDHDHKNGRVRGLLCNRCNRALGMFKDDPIILQRAAEYVA